MKRVFVLLTVFVIVFVLFQANLSLADDVRMFNYYQIKYKINDKFDVFIQPDMRFNDDIRELYYYHIRNGVTFHALENLDLGATYRFLESKSGSQWPNEHRLELEAMPKITLGDYKLSYRGRFEYRWLQNAADRWRYRSLGKVAYMAEIGDFAFTPYISNEIFYDFEINKLHMNRATLGADKKINENLLLGLFYLNETARAGETDEWNTRHYIGTKIVVSF
ncbi:MAG: DUF2490 domain-containing protein [Candidatus Omnitrophica bacterium]|nr:DUF2490 domain-containing protein [Candidatus Omnitrophota bacterium]